MSELAMRDETISRVIDQLEDLSEELNLLISLAKRGYLTDVLRAQLYGEERQEHLDHINNLILNHTTEADNVCVIALVTKNLVA